MSPRSFLFTATQPHRLLPAMFVLCIWLAVSLFPASSHARDARGELDVPAASSPSTPQAAGKGFVDKAEVRDGVLTLQGWAAAYNPSVYVTLVEIWLGDQRIYRGRLGFLMNRPDVVESTKQALWLNSGFHLPVRLPQDISSGTFPLRVQITNGDGGRFELDLSESARQVQIPAGERKPSMKAKLALALAALLPVAYLLVAFARREGVAGARGFVAMVLASFVLLVAGGWSGSSLPLLLDRAKILQHDGANFIGKAQEVRRDEWLIVTPLAMSQAVEPNWLSSVNPLHGVYGQNMNVVGMSGAPTLGLEAIAKPASWGFFALDLKRALAWHWWFPFFACFLAVWAVLRCWFALDWRKAAVLAVLVPGSAYSVGWSGWPAYVSFFPVLAAWAAVRLFLAENKVGAAFWGLVLGWAAAGFVLVLYPGWQIPLAYLMALLTLAQLWQMRAQMNWGVAQAIGVVLAALVGGALLAAWWSDAQEAIRALGQTVYPGQRSMELGGYVEPWHLSKGLANLVTLYESSQWSIPSDAAGSLYLLIPLAVATVLRFTITRSVDAFVAVLWLFIAFVLIHMFVGIPAWLARATLWGKVPAFRLDVVLALAQVFLLGHFLKEASALKQWSDGSRLRVSVLQVLGAATAVGFAWFNWHCLTMMPVPMQDWLNPAVFALVLAGAAWLAYLLVRGQVWNAVAISAAWTLAVSLPFNPLQQAPQHVQLVPELQSALKRPGGSVPARVAVVNEDLWVSALPISGVSVVNSFFYDPPLKFWRDLDPEGKLDQVYNRYQFMQIKLEPKLAAADFQITSPRMDAVTLSVQPERFDFAKVKADFVLANVQDAEQLKGNTHLQLEKTDGANWTLFRVLADGK
ncbi:hypothetical protein G7048_07535 [Diaphorobacter sp. HDW4B]|uniref:DUF7657 domain-containing protein n=1 Tax=Diaphorobacter sp. HDW4B TaxID=2714925 RepID=UPI00140B7A7E|nr:hypothetical protein [Diaphorobacter sp. HDW4B]QIL70218.1 hypothetical protein G7048_07535 [Diaphorobacter sp. HDW4B]